MIPQNATTSNVNLNAFDVSTVRRDVINTFIYFTYVTPILTMLFLDIVENTLLHSNETDATQTRTDSNTFETQTQEATQQPQIETNEFKEDVPTSFPSCAEDNTKPRDVDNTVNSASNVLADNDTMSFDLVQRILQMTSRTVDDLDSFIEQNSSVG